MDAETGLLTKGAEYYHGPERADLAVKDIDEAGTFTGYASVFGRKDLQDEIVEKGAFKKSINDKAGRFKLLWQHDHHVPIGTLQAVEDEKGLRVKGQLLLEHSVARDAHALLKGGVVDGMSIGFNVVKDEWTKGVRHLKELALWEVSLVTFPANPHALVSGVKSHAANLPIAPVDTPWNPEGQAERLGALKLDGKSFPPGVVHMQLVDVVDGQVMVIPRALYAEAARLLTEEKSEDNQALRAHLARYYRRLDRDPPWAAPGSLKDLAQHVVDLAEFADPETLACLAGLKRDQEEPLSEHFDWLAAERLHAEAEQVDSLGLLQAFGNPMT